MENKQNETTTKPYKVKNQSLTLKEIMYRRDKETKRIKQIRFKTDIDEVITFKPTFEIAEVMKNKGVVFEESENVMPTREQLIEKYPIFKELESTIQNSKKVSVLCDFNKWDTIQKDGTKVTYGFFYETDISKLQIV